MKSRLVMTVQAAALALPLSPPEATSKDPASGAEPVFADGTWIEFLRLEGSSDLAVTAGVLLGATGSIHLAFGLDAGPGLIPLGVAGDLASAVQQAGEVYAQLQGAIPVRAGGEPGFDLDDCNCLEQFGAGHWACVVAWRTCHASCLDTLSAAMKGCAVEGPPDPKCIWAAMGAFRAGYIACLVGYVVCMDHAMDSFIECQNRCVIRPLVSDHGP